jgi:O-antigen/teichoic acid export membrane protein
MIKLTRRAILTAGALALDQASRVLTQWVLAPILIAILGPNGFGLWQWLHRAFLNLSSLDGRAGETIKWYIATKQTQDNKAWKNQVLGAGFSSYLVFLPVLGVAVVAFYSVADERLHQSLDRLSGAVVILVMSLTVLFQSVSNLYQGVLRGENLGYRKMGVNAAIIVVTAILMGLAVWRGYGILGLCVSQLLGAMLMTLANFGIAHKIFDWLTVAKPDKALRRRFTKHTSLMSAWGFIETLLLGGEIIILGWLSTIALVSKFYLTVFAPQLIAAALGLLVTSMLPGLASIYGQGDVARFHKVKNELKTYMFLAATGLGVVVILVNELFVSAWVGYDYFAGPYESMLLVMMMLQLSYLRLNTAILNFSLRLREKAGFGLISTAVVIVLASALVPRYEIIGLCAAFLVGRLLMHILVIHALKSEKRLYPAARERVKQWRQWLCASAVLLGAFVLSADFAESGMAHYAPLSVLYSVAALLFVFFVGVDRDGRLDIVARLKIALNRKS